MVKKIIKCITLFIVATFICTISKELWTKPLYMIVNSMTVGVGIYLGIKILEAKN
ncbi:MAG: hypothetical protein ACRC76_04475 [Proteocatella sp.]